MFVVAAVAAGLLPFKAAGIGMLGLQSCCTRMVNARFPTNENPCRTKSNLSMNFSQREPSAKPLDGSGRKDLVAKMKAIS